MYMASFTPLSNHLDSVVKISVFSNSTECWGCLTWICFATSEGVELGLRIRCSINLDLRNFSVSPTYIASHSSHKVKKNIRGLTKLKKLTGIRESFFASERFYPVWLSSVCCMDYKTRMDEFTCWDTSLHVAIITWCRYLPVYSYAAGSSITQTVVPCTQSSTQPRFKPMTFRS